MLHSAHPSTPTSGVHPVGCSCGCPRPVSESPAKKSRAAQPREEDANAASLGKTLKDFVGRAAGGGGRRKASRYRLQRFAADLVPDHRGLGACGWKMLPDASGVAVRGKASPAGGYETAHLGNLLVCGSHLCPVCGPRIAEVRREEVAQVIDWAKAQGLHPIMVTLTTANKLGDALRPMAEAQKRALRALKRDRRYKARRPFIVGVVSAFETTHGGNGWHPHIHLLLLVKASTMGRALRLVAGLRKPWGVAAKAEGLHTGRAGFRADPGHEAADYMAKWDLSHEVAASTAKKGKDKGRTPAQILRAAYGGDVPAARLWAEYATAMKGKSVLRFSQGLKAAAGIDEVADEEAAAAPEDDRRKLIDVIPGDLWEEAKTKGLDRDDLRQAAKEDGRKGIRAYLAMLRETDDLVLLE